mgnify:CR=1 FL=1
MKPNENVEDNGLMTKGNNQNGKLRISLKNFY